MIKPFFPREAATSVQKVQVSFHHTEVSSVGLFIAIFIVIAVIVDLDDFVVVIPDVYWCLLIGAGSVLSHAVFLISRIAHILGNICWSIYIREPF